MRMKLKYKIYRYVAFYLALNIVFEIVSPTVAMALTYGPYQPEYTAFEPASNTDMVDLFSGNFKYNIPLLDVDGYPVNLSYSAGPTMDEEAGWVGLGWNLNAGSLNRSVRGLPDDFKGEGIQTVTNVKKQLVIGVGKDITWNSNGSISYSSTSVGHGSYLQAGYNFVFNNYKGYGIELHRDMAHSVSLAQGIGPFTLSGGVGVGVGDNISSQEGATFSYSTSRGHGEAVGFSMFGVTLGVAQSQNLGVGTNINTRTGAAYKTYNGSSTKGVFAAYSMSAGTSSNGTSLSTGGSVSMNWGKGAFHSVPISSISYSPKNSNDFVSQSMSFSMKSGLYTCAGIQWGAWGASHENGIYLGLNAYSNTTDISDKNRTRPAYGYFHLEEANENSLMDFNRSNEGPLHRESPSLPMAFHTYDIFSASAQGLYSNFRAHRSDVGLVYDNTSKLSGNSIGIGMEMGFGLLMHLAFNKYQGTSLGTNGKLSSSMDRYHNYYAPDVTNPATNYYEKYYLKNFGEMTATDAAFDAKVNGTAVITPNLYKTSGASFDFSSPIAGNASSINANQSAIYKTQRDFRNTNYHILDAKQASQYGAQKKLRNYTSNSLSIDPALKQVSGFTESSRLAYGRDNHMSEVSVTSPDGRRYIYGDPDYNLMTKTTVFNASEKNILGFVGGLWLNADKSLVSYDATTFSTSNNRGLDNLYKQETTPSYAQFVLLSSILSEDYVDLTGNGPSYDDLGDYTKFNYSTLNTAYGWRTPYNSSPLALKQAVLDKGLIADEFDDKGVVDYGQKELKYLHSIETKNYVALFKVSKRKDALGVTNIDGGFPTQGGSDQRMYKLDRIELYTKNELIRAAAAATAPVPLKTVNFEYNYSLCRGVSNNVEVIYNTGSTDKGKLTLTRIWFTYGNSDKGSLAPYQFFYGDPDHNRTTDFNPDYNMKAVDKWGFYKPSSGSATGDGGVLNNDEFPYVEGSKAQVDEYMGAWNLSTIVTPTGSQTDIDYEADDYGHVQDEPAGQMVKILDITNSTIELPFWTPPFIANSITSKNILILDLRDFKENGIKTSDPVGSGDLFKRLFNENENLYFKCYTKLNKITEQGLPKIYWDYVPGYAKIHTGQTMIYRPTDTYTIGSDTYYRYVAVHIQRVGYKDNDNGKQINPITKAGWQFTRKYLPRIAYPGSEPSTTSPTNPFGMIADIVAGLGTSTFDLAASAADPNLRFLAKMYCDEIDNKKSFVRLYNPSKKRPGGGHRVKQILISDEWGSMATDPSNSANNEKTSVYGQKYEYTTIDKNTGKKISSGVAQYEPMAGGDEISLRRPRHFEINNRMAPNDNLFQEEPYGENLYPAPQVGYSEVKVTNVGKLKNSGAEGCGIGSTVYEFYTAKDFPVKVRTSGKAQDAIEPDPIDGFTVISSIVQMYAAAQGYVVELNDMHGKIRSVKTYGEAGPSNLVSSTVYSYKQTGAGPYSLVNTVQTIDENNVIQNEVIGRSIDLTTDVRTSRTLNFNMGVSKSSNISPCTLGFPSVTSDLFIGSQFLGYSCASMTKVIQSHGILYKTETSTNSLRSSQENILWDRKTGDVVLTKTVNNFDAPVYAFNYPAHWMYKGMSGQYKRDGFTLKIPANNTTIFNYTNGQLTTASISPFLTDGDEVAFYDANYTTTIRAWVYFMPGQNKYYLIDETGKILNTTNFTAINPATEYFVKVTRPDEKNYLNRSAGHVVTLTNPVSGSALALNTGIVSSTATEWCKNWNLYSDNTYENATGLLYKCGNKFVTGAAAKTINPVTSGYASKWAVLKEYAFRTPRFYSAQNNISTDGTYQNYSPFWVYASGSWNKHTAGAYFLNWIPMAASTMISPDGNQMEALDALGKYSARDFSFHQTLLNAEASNTKYNQMGYESFEAYASLKPYLTDCGMASSDHLDFFKNIDLVYNGSSAKAFLDNTTAHTGRYSLRFNNGKKVVLNHFGQNDGYVDKYFFLFTGSPNSQVLPYRCDNAFTERGKDYANSIQIGKLHLDDGNYVISFWVKGPSTFTDFAGMYNLSLKIAGASQTPLSVDKTPVINGWQKFDVVYKVVAMPYTAIDISFAASLPAGVSYIHMDDFRIHPYNSRMTSYVYDPVNLRVWASLDERNFASVIEYDNEGKPVRAKKETDKGIYTVAEGRKGSIKN